MFLIIVLSVVLGVERMICVWVYCMGVVINKRIKSVLSNLGFFIN